MSALFFIRVSKRLIKNDSICHTKSSDLVIYFEILPQNRLF